MTDTLTMTVRMTGGDFSFMYPAGTTFWVVCATCSGTGRMMDFTSSPQCGSMSLVECSSCQGRGTIQLTQPNFSPVYTDPVEKLLSTEERLRTLEFLLGQQTMRIVELEAQFLNLKRKQS